MNRISVAVLAGASLVLACCTREKPAPVPAQNDPHAHGIGRFAGFTVPDSINRDMAEQGGRLFLQRCASCHNLTGDRLVGPGWEGVTLRREPAWIMNFLTNVDEMIDKDPAAQVMMENCLVRMPDPRVTDEQARQLLEFMRRNDRMAGN